MTTSTLLSLTSLPKQILITGGAGFIGSHLADALILHGCKVRLLDNLSPQIHGEALDGDRRSKAKLVPTYLNQEAELVVGDIRNAEVVEQALQDIDAVVHLAAAVGVGQSMYEIRRYTDVNATGTAVLLEALSQKPVQRLICASSMSVYGEGAGRDEQGNPLMPGPRLEQDLAAQRWQPRQLATPLPTSETKPPQLQSIYALNKFTQEQMCLIAGSAYGIPTTALRFFNAYGPRQALSNPYTGVLAIFACQLLNNRRPQIFEDGKQQRDFVHVSDLVQGLLLSLQESAPSGEIINLGSGQQRSIVSVARELAAAMGKPHIEPEINGKYRAGDIRHCFADISKAQQLLGYRPAVDFRDGLRDLAGWLENQYADDRSAAAKEELVRRGLVA